MSRPLSLKTVLEKNKISGDKPFYVMLEIDVKNQDDQFIQTVYLVNAPDPLEYRGKTYQPMPFRMTVKQEVGTQSEITVSMTDYTKAVIEKMNQYGGGVGFSVRLIVVSEDTVKDNYDPDLLEYFEVTASTVSDYNVSFKIGVENFLVQRVPKRVQRRDFCSWSFKDDNCRYSGAATTCDLSLNGANGCKAKGNQERFGGFPQIISMESRNA